MAVHFFSLPDNSPIENTYEFTSFLRAGSELSNPTIQIDPSLREHQIKVFNKPLPDSWQDSTNRRVIMIAVGPLVAHVVTASYFKGKRDTGPTWQIVTSVPGEAMFDETILEPGENLSITDPRLIQELGLQQFAMHMNAVLRCWGIERATDLNKILVRRQSAVVTVHGVQLPRPRETTFPYLYIPVKIDQFKDGISWNPSATNSKVPLVFSSSSALPRPAFESVDNLTVPPVTNTELFGNRRTDGGVDALIPQNLGISSVEASLVVESFFTSFQQNSGLTTNDEPLNRRATDLIPAKVHSQVVEQLHTRKQV